jgi:excisionase family DNA binding protein
MTQERRFLTPAEAADELRVSTDTILRLISSGELPAIRVSPRVIRIPKPAFDFFREGRKPKQRRVITRKSTAEFAIGTDEEIPRGEPV